jgi:thymidine phosphorylase
VVRRIDVAAVGRVVLALGGGRRLPTDAIDARVGLSEVAGLGTAIGRDRPFCLIHARSEAAAAEAESALRAAVVLGRSAPSPTPLILGRR